MAGGGVGVLPPLQDFVGSPNSEGPGDEAWQRAKAALAELWTKERQN